jgi:predicted nucleotidyltransferase
MSLDVAKALRSFFSTRTEGVAAVYLFGSVARGRARPGSSDVDIGLLAREAPPRTFAGLPLDLEGELERLLRQPVDLVLLNTAPVDLVHRVLRDGELIAEPDRAARIRFEVKARNEYFDLLPILTQYRRLGTRTS